MTSTLRYFIHLTGIVLLAVLLSRGAVYLAALSFLDPVDPDDGYAMYDLYVSALNRRAVEQKTDIVVVSTDGLTREQVGALVSEVDACAPAVIGVDVLFVEPHPEDAVLLSRLAACPHLVLASVVEADTLSSVFSPARGSYFENRQTLTFGAANLVASEHADVVREFRPCFTTATDTVLSFAAAVAAQVDDEVVRRACIRRGDTDPIDYPSQHYELLEGTVVLAGEYNPAELTDRVVLLGDLYNMHDTYITPIDRKMPGVMIQAHIVQTILSEHTVTRSSAWFEWLVGILLCILFTALNLQAKERLSNAGNLFIRMVQFAMLFLMFWIGTKLFAEWHYFFDSTVALLMIGFGALAFDVWFGLIAILNKIRKT